MFSLRDLIMFTTDIAKIIRSSKQLEDNTGISVDNTYIYKRLPDTKTAFVQVDLVYFNTHALKIFHFKRHTPTQDRNQQ